MGHRAGWLTLGAGIAGGADVILIPEIPYDVEKIAEAIRRRSRNGTNFSIVAVAEGAMSRDDARALLAAEKKLERARTLHDKKEAKIELAALEVRHQGNTLRLAKHLEELTHLESRVTILGYVQRGGTPSAADRLLATRLGSACGDLIHEEHFGVMVAARGDGTEPVALERVAGKRKIVPPTIPGWKPPGTWERAWAMSSCRRLSRCIRVKIPIHDSVGQRRERKTYPSSGETDCKTRSLLDCSASNMKKYLLCSICTLLIASIATASETNNATLQPKEKSMSAPSVSLGYVVLYVKDVSASLTFYE